MKPLDPHRELFVLGLLRRVPLSAYSIDRAMREHIPLYRRFSRGNVYALVERLADNGLLVRQSTPARRGPREAKWVYHLSAAGEARFRELLETVMVDVQSSDVALEIALVLLGQIPRQQALHLVVARIREIRQQERRLARLYGDARGSSGAGYFSRLRVVHRMKSEQRFLDEIAGLLRDPKWEPQWIYDDGPVNDPARKL